MNGIATDVGGELLASGSAGTLADHFRGSGSFQIHKPAVITIANYVSGKLLAPPAGRYLDDIEPATGRPYALVPGSDAVDLEAPSRRRAGRFRAGRGRR